MDRLLNIDRNDGYPLCAENLSIIDTNARMLEIFLANLELPDKSAIRLLQSIPSGGGFNMTILWLFVFFSNTQRELLRIGTGSGLLLQSPQPDIKVTLRMVSQNVTNEYNTTFEDVYQHRFADLEETDDPNEAWTFYRLTDVLEPALYSLLQNHYGNLMAVLSGNLSIPIPIPNSNSEICPDSSVLSNGRKLRLKSHYWFIAPSVNGDGTLIINCNYGVSSPAPVVCHYTSNGGDSGTILGHITNNSINLPMDEFVAGSEYDLYFNQEILL